MKFECVLIHSEMDLKHYQRLKNWSLSFLCLLYFAHEERVNVFYDLNDRGSSAR